MACTSDDAADYDDMWVNFMQNYDEQKDEILALKSFYENTENFEIIQEACVDGTKLNSLQLRVNIETRGTGICVEIWVPMDVAQSQTDDATEDECVTPKQPVHAQRQNYALERSISGHRGHVQINCDYLPPLIVNIVLPMKYPSTSEPIFSISCFWLNKSQLSRLCRELDRIWNEYREMPVVYTWIQWLQEQTLEYLDIFELPNRIIVTPVDSPEDTTCRDSRAINEFNDVQGCIYQFLRFNYIEELKSFRNSIHTCSVCFDEKMGRDFIRINGCKHVFCIDCLREYVNMHVTDGTVQLLKCAEKGCDSEIAEDIMQIVLNKEQYERWSRLLLQFTLDTMDDVMYCPKCSFPIIADEHAYCMKCNLDFCRSCKDVWHVGPCISEMEKLNLKMKDMKLNVEQLLNMTDEQIRKQFKNSSLVMQLKKKTEVKYQEQNDILLKFKPCPKCKARIDKFEGCNKVVCRCGTTLCYVCGKQINGYEHFNDNPKCNLWSGNGDVANRVPERELHPGQRAVARVINLLPDQQRNIIHCPSCGQDCLKLERNNHIKCWLCSTNFCFSCKSKINGNVTAHFRNAVCKQHSD